MWQPCAISVLCEYYSSQEVEILVRESTKKEMRDVHQKWQTFEGTPSFTDSASHESLTHHNVACTYPVPYHYDLSRSIG